MNVIENLRTYLWNAKPTSIYVAVPISDLRKLLDEPVETLVEAGVLKEWAAPGCEPSVHYVVVQPHKHEWTIRRTSGPDELVGKSVVIFCATCPNPVATERWVPNHLPIEVPE